MHFLNENVLISIKNSLTFIPTGPINNIPTLVQIMAWCRPGDKSLSGPWWLFYWCIYASLGLNEFLLGQTPVGSKLLRLISGSGTAGRNQQQPDFQGTCSDLAETEEYPRNLTITSIRTQIQMLLNTYAWPMITNKGQIHNKTVLSRHATRKSSASADTVLSRHATRECSASADKYLLQDEPDNVCCSQHKRKHLIKERQ